MTWAIITQDGTALHDNATTSHSIRRASHDRATTSHSIKTASHDLGIT
jgi:hypothetical protein